MYIIKSPRLGVVGTEFVPKPGVQVAGLIWGGFIVEVADEAKPSTNIAALIWGGFIKEVEDEPTEQVSTPAPKKGAKNKKATKED